MTSQDKYKSLVLAYFLPLSKPSSQHKVELEIFLLSSLCCALTAPILPLLDYLTQSRKRYRLTSSFNCTDFHRPVIFELKLIKRKILKILHDWSCSSLHLNHRYHRNRAQNRRKFCPSSKTKKYTIKSFIPWPTSIIRVWKLFSCRLNTDK